MRRVVLRWRVLEGWLSLRPVPEAHTGGSRQPPRAQTAVKAVRASPCAVGPGLFHAPARVINWRERRGTMGGILGKALLNLPEFMEGQAVPGPSPPAQLCATGCCVLLALPTRVRSADTD